MKNKLVWMILIDKTLWNVLLLSVKKLLRNGKRKRKSSKIVVDKPKKLQGENKRKSCVRKHKKKRNCVELKKSRKLNGPKSAKNGSEIKY